MGISDKIHEFIGRRFQSPTLALTGTQDSASLPKTMLSNQRKSFIRTACLVICLSMGSTILAEPTDFMDKSTSCTTREELLEKPKLKPYLVKEYKIKLDTVFLSGTMSDPMLVPLFSYLINYIGGDPRASIIEDVSFEEVINSLPERTEHLGDFEFLYPSGEILNWSRPAPGAYYVDCDDPSRSSVRFFIKNYFYKDNPDYVKPSLGWKRLVYGDDGQEDSFYNFENFAKRRKKINQVAYRDEVFGLEKFYTDSSQTNRNAHYFYRPLDQSKFEMRMDCPPEWVKQAFVACDASVYWPEDGLAIEVSFLRRNLPHWESIILMVRENILKWRQAGSNYKTQKSRLTILGDATNVKPN